MLPPEPGRQGHPHQRRFLLRFGSCASACCLPRRLPPPSTTAGASRDLYSGWRGRKRSRTYEHDGRTCKRSCAAYWNACWHILAASPRPRCDDGVNVCQRSSTFIFAAGDPRLPFRRLLPPASSMAYSAKAVAPPPKTRLNRRAALSWRISSVATLWLLLPPPILCGICPRQTSCCCFVASVCLSI